MRHLAPRQRESDKRWDYTSTLGKRIVPVGYCHAYREDEYLKQTSPQYYRLIEENKHKYHADGHETAEEACECYKDYLLDTALRHFDNVDQQEKCRVCEQWTTHRVQIAGWETLVLCNDHATREEISLRFDIGESFES